MVFECRDYIIIRIASFVLCTHPLFDNLIRIHTHFGCMLLYKFIDVSNSLLKIFTFLLLFLACSSENVTNQFRMFKEIAYPRPYCFVNILYPH